MARLSKLKAVYLLCASVPLWSTLSWTIDERLRLARVVQGAHAGALGLDEDRHVSGLVLVLHHLGMRAGNLQPGEHLRHAGVDPPFDDQLVGHRTADRPLHV